MRDNKNILYANKPRRYVVNGMHGTCRKKTFQMLRVSDKRDGSEDNLIIDYDQVVHSTNNDRSDVIIIEEEADVVDNSNVDDVRDMVENNYTYVHATDNWDDYIEISLNCPHSNSYININGLK